MEDSISKETHIHLTMEAFLHGVEDLQVLDPLTFIKDMGANLEVSTNGTAHAEFDGKVSQDEAQLVLAWGKDVTTKATAGRVVILIGKSEPNDFEWHDIGTDRQSWQQGFNEYVSLFGTKFTHLVKR